MKSKLLVIAIISALMSLPATSQTTHKLTAGKVNEYGLTYTLPLTSFSIRLAATKTVRQPGEFAAYARKYLHLEPIITPSVQWTLSGAEIIPQAIADDTERYLVQFKNGSSPFIILEERGIPIAINDEEYVPQPVVEPTLKAIEAVPTPLEVPAAKQAVTEDMLRSHSSAKRAELAAARIYEIRQQRSDIISGQADGMPGDGQAMQLALDNLQAQEAALTAMFVGTVKTSVEVSDFEIMPPVDEEPLKFVVARLSATDGLVDASNLSGQPVYIEFSEVENATLPVNEKGETKSFPKGGLAYRIPGQATLSLFFDGKRVAREKFDIAQYGVVFGLEPGLFTDKKAPSYLRFFPLTGAIREIGTRQPL